MSVREVAAEAYREGVPAIAASAVAGLLAGVVLGGMRRELRAVPGLLVLVPALLATRGNVYGSFGARLATGLHQGFVEPTLRDLDPRARAAAAAAVIDGLLTNAFAAVVAVAVLRGLSREASSLPALLAVSLLAGLLAGALLSATVLVVAIVGFRRGYNPDTIVGPVVTTAGDVFGVALLLLAVRIVLAVAGG